MNDPLIIKGSRNAELIIVTEAPSHKDYERHKVMGEKELALCGTQLKRNGFKPSKTVFITCAAPIPSEATTESKVAEHLAEYREELLAAVNQYPDAKLLIYFGKDAGRQVTGRAVKITKARGTIQHLDDLDCAVLPMLAPRTVRRRPHYMEDFETDFNIAGTYRESEWQDSVFEGASREANYTWETDLQFLIDMKPKRLVVDVETVGLKWYDNQRLLTVQLCWAKGQACNVPIDIDYWNHDDFGKKQQKKVIKQLRKLLGNKKTGCVGHNFKFDLHSMLNHNIKVANFEHDTIQLAFAADDNMERKDLDGCTRRWVQAMAGYADIFNKDPIHQGKSRMDLVPHEDMLFYGCGDVDATFRLCERLVSIVKEDSKNWKAYNDVHMPALRTMFEMERTGVDVDIEALDTLKDFVISEEKRLYAELIVDVPAKVRRKHLNDPRHKKKTPREVLSFTRDAFTTDTLFTADGFNLTPLVFTDSTKKLEESERVPSASIKLHLPLHDHPFITKLIEYKKILKFVSTYVGRPKSTHRETVRLLKSGKYSKGIVDAFASIDVELPTRPKAAERTRIITLDKINPVTIIRGVPKSDKSIIDYALMSNDTIKRQITEPDTGFYQYLPSDMSHRIYTQFTLWRTVTGRSSSASPNFQNFPKRGELAEFFREVFLPPKGWVMLECDLSQIELRIAAWMANEQTMIDIFCSGGDIHSATAASTMQLSMDQFRELSKTDQKANRQKAKAVNFGFIYGMWWVKFKDYAKTDYGVELTDSEAEATRELFFDTYPQLNQWHWDMKNFAQKHGYVRALHGALRRLPDVNSSDESIQKEAQRQAINSSVQRFGSDLGLMGLTDFARCCPREVMRPISFVHDASYIVAREDYAEEAASSIKYCMESIDLERRFNLHAPIPLPADVCGFGENMNDLPDLDSVVATRPDWYKAA